MALLVGALTDYYYYFAAWRVLMRLCLVINVKLGLWGLWGAYVTRRYEADFAGAFEVAGRG